MSVRGVVLVKRAFCLLIVGAVIAGIVFAFMCRQEISDFFRATTFDPSPRASEVFHELQLTGAGERIFLASRPTVEGSQLFNEQCADVDQSEQGHVLGCFSDERIHLFDVSDERLGGIVEVTAAHELLHAAWARLDDRERADLAVMLREEFDARAAQDPELAERMSVYEHLSEMAFANELHSVLGTEVRDLSAPLEAHYATWLADREALVQFFDSYHGVFADLQQQANALEAEMTPLREDIERRNAAYDVAVRDFNRDAANLSARLERREFSKAPGEYQRERNELARRRDDLQAELAQLRIDIDRYNALRDQLADVSEVSVELDSQLDSRLAPASTRPNG